MKKEKFFASRKEDISRAACDFFSIGHIMMGQLFFWIAYMLFTISSPFSAPFLSLGLTSEWWDVLISVILGILWEPFENIVMYYAGWKFEGRRDSLLNAMFDIIFWSLGAIAALLINNWIINLVLVVIEIIAWSIIRWYFLNLPDAIS
ncbi:MAG: DUF2585 family protein [Promethearchaeota archaeon]